MAEISRLFVVELILNIDDLRLTFFRKYCAPNVP